MFSTQFMNLLGSEYSPDHSILPCSSQNKELEGNAYEGPQFAWNLSCYHIHLGHTFVLDHREPQGYFCPTNLLSSHIGETNSAVSISSLTTLSIMFLLTGITVE